MRRRSPRLTAGMLSLRKFALPVLAAAGIAAADQWTKAWIVSRYNLYEARAVVDGFFHLVHIRNTGVAFGLLSSLDPKWVNPLLVVATVFAIAGVIAYIHFLPRRVPALLGLGLVLGGALGNLIDRARLGYVVDFLDVHWRHHHWPAFNVADIGISVGIVLLLVDMLCAPKEEENAPRPS